MIVWFVGFHAVNVLVNNWTILQNKIPVGNPACCVIDKGMTDALTTNDSV